MTVATCLRSLADARSTEGECRPVHNGAAIGPLLVPGIDHFETAGVEIADVARGKLGPAGSRDAHNLGIELRDESPGCAPCRADLCKFVGCAAFEGENLAIEIDIEDFPGGLPRRREAA